MIAEDIVQSVFLKFYENFENIKNIESANYWLFRTARNEYYNYYRKNKRNSRIDEDLIEIKQDEYELETHIEIKEMKTLILTQLNKMDEDQKEVYLLKEYGELSYKEISETLEIDENLVKSRLYKVRQKLISKISKMV